MLYLTLWTSSRRFCAPVNILYRHYISLRLSKFDRSLRVFFFASKQIVILNKPNRRFWSQRISRYFGFPLCISSVLFPSICKGYRWKLLVVMQQLNLEEISIVRIRDRIKASGLKLHAGKQSGVQLSPRLCSFSSVTRSDVTSYRLFFIRPLLWKNIYHTQSVGPPTRKRLD